MAATVSVDDGAPIPAVPAAVVPPVPAMRSDERTAYPGRASSSEEMRAIDI